MASPNAVKKYLAYWFQLGKKLIIANQDQAILLTKVVNGDRFSTEFEECWQLVSNPQTGDCYLEGTSNTIQELLTPKWEITPCARCEMPVPIIDVGVQNLICVCSDLDNWPNNELPPPREPVNNQEKLKSIRQSLGVKADQKPKKLSLKAKKTEHNTRNYLQSDLEYLQELAIQQIKEGQLSKFVQKSD